MDQKCLWKSNRSIMRTKEWRKKKEASKFKRRLVNLGVLGEVNKYYCYKQQSTPCSCYMCSYLKYRKERTTIKNKEKHEREFL